MTESQKRDELDRLDDAVLDDILGMTNAEVQQELESLGFKSGDGLSVFERALIAAKGRAGFVEFRKARVEFLEDRRKREARSRPQAPDEARAFLHRVQSELSELTIAARNADGSELSDRDALAQLEDVLELLEELNIDLGDESKK